MKKKVLIFLVLGILILIGSLIGLFFSPIGESLVKDYVLSRIKILKNFEIVNFNYGFNSFSMIIKKDDNKVNLVGSLFPFDANYEAEFNDISKLSDSFRGKVKSLGEVRYKNGFDFIKGNALFANGFSTIDFKCNGNCIGTLSGKDFNTVLLLWMLKSDLHYFKGINDLNLVVLKDKYKVKSHFVGEFNYKPFLLIKNINIDLDGNIKNRENFNFNIKAFANKFNLNMNLINNNKFQFQGDAKTDFSYLKNVLIYPLKGVINLSFNYNENIFRFSCENIEGYLNKNILTINFSNFPLKKFFKYIGINPFIDANFNGVVNIDLKNKIGKVDFVSDKCEVIQNNKIVKALEAKIGGKFSTLKAIFFKGTFDTKKVKFSLLSKDKKFLFFIKNGIYFYNGKYSYDLEIDVVNNSKKVKYFFKVEDGKVKLLNKKIFAIKTDEVLVY